MSAERLKRISKVLTSLTILMLLYIFINNNTYNFIKSLYIPNWQKYVEIKAYISIQPKDIEKYFIVQDNDYVKSYLAGVSTIKSSNEIVSREPTDGSIWLFARPDEAIIKKAAASNADITALNSGQNIEFYVARFTSVPKSCRVGG